MDKTNIEVSHIEESEIDQIISIGINTPEFKTGTEAAQFYSKETLADWINDPNGITLAARVEGRLAGFFLGYYMTGPNDGYMNCITVLPEYRGIGVGKQLQEKALHEFEHKGPEGRKCDHVFGLTEESNEATLKFAIESGLQVGKKFYYIETMLPRRKEGEK